MVNKCPRCGMAFQEWPEYHMHLAFAHYQETLEIFSPELRTHSSGRADLVRRVYPGPMAKDKKALIVLEGERRLGRDNFYAPLS